MFLLIHQHTARRNNTLHFNTSHVSINLLSAAFQICSKLNFNTSHVSINLWVTFLVVLLDSNFNTSHVSINPILVLNSQMVQKYFNTSHVSINPTLLSAFPFLLYLKFLENTSFFKFFPSVSQT